MGLMHVYAGTVGYTRTLCTNWAIFGSPTSPVRNMLSVGNMNIVITLSMSSFSHAVCTGQVGMEYVSVVMM